jgi:hypothetical protein
VLALARRGYLKLVGEGNNVRGKWLRTGDRLLIQNLCNLPRLSLSCNKFSHLVVGKIAEYINLDVPIFIVAVVAKLDPL